MAQGSTRRDFLAGAPAVFLAGAQVSPVASTRNKFTLIATCRLVYDDGSSHEHPVRRRYEINPPGALRGDLVSSQSPSAAARAAGASMSISDRWLAWFPSPPSMPGDGFRRHTKAWGRGLIRHATPGVWSRK